MEFSQSIESIFRTKNGFALFGLCLITLEFLTAIVFFICPCMLGETSCNVQYFKETYSLFAIFFTSVIVGPLLETFFFQFVILKPYIFYFKERTINTDLILISISASVFGIGHYYNILTIIHAFFSGLVLGSIYLFQQEKRNKPFFFTFLLHSLFNLIAFIIDDVMHWA